MKENNRYVIGVDGGGTKTIAALADLQGKIIKTAKTGSANPRNAGMEAAILNISEAILKLTKNLKRGIIKSVVVGTPSVQEEYKLKKPLLIKEVFKNKAIKNILRGKIGFVSDQIVAFKSATDKKDGIVLIAGTGSVCRGWHKKKDFKANGWGWLADEGSGFWIGQQAFQAVFKDLDKRGPKTKITKLLIKKWKAKTKEDLAFTAYAVGTVRTISLVSRIVDQAALLGDRIAKNILKKAAHELALSAIIVIKELKLTDKKFPLALVGSTINSKIILPAVKKEIKKIAPKADFISPRKSPVTGAVKLAIENIH